MAQLVDYLSVLFFNNTVLTVSGVHWLCVLTLIMAYIKNPVQAVSYCKFRPSPPKELIEKVVSFLKEEIKPPLRKALDVGCGSGQSTAVLAPHFQQVVGVDSSSEQLHHAQLHNIHKNVSYRLGAAEELQEPDSSVDLVTVGMAVHWFDLAQFSGEVARVLRPGGALALYGYNLPRPSGLGEAVLAMIGSSLGQYFPDQSKLVYFDGYKGDQFSKFPFSKQPSLRFEFLSTKTNASVKDLVGYISTMSGFQNYAAKHGEAAAQKLLSDFKSLLAEQLGAGTDSEEAVCDITFPYFLLLSRKDL